MKIFSLQENLKQGLFITGHITGKNINLPILNNILIESKKGNIKLISTNLEIGIVSFIRGKIEKEGVYTIDAKIISDCINLLPNKKISLEQKEDSLIIGCENYLAKIKGKTAEEYPLIPEIERKIYFSALVSKFKKALTQVVFAVSTSESRLALTGVLFEFNKDNLILAATDSYRLAEKKISIKANGDKNNNKVIVPAKTLQELLRILSVGTEEESTKDQEEIKFYISENQILFTCAQTELVSRLIEGQYPDYTQIIPNNYKTSTIIERAELMRAVKLASLFSKAGINDINLDFPANKNQVIVSAVSGQTGENITKLDAKVTGADNGIVINYRYLLDGLNNINSDMIKIEIVDGNTPFVLKSEDDHDYSYVIMPIKQ